MKKLLSIIGAIGLGVSAPVPLLANTPNSQAKEEKTTDIITIDGIEYKKQKIDINYYGTNNVLSINVFHNDNVIVSYFDKNYFIKSNEINAVEINNSVLKDKLGNEYFTENGKLFIKDNSNTKTEIKKN